MHFSRFLALPFVCIQLVLADPVPDPTITPAPRARRQESSGAASSTHSYDVDSFIGYYSSDSSYVADYCADGYTMVYSSSFAACCDATASACDIVTSCGGTSSNMAYMSGSSSDCGDAATCDTDFIYSTIGDAYPQLWLGCADETQHAYFLQIPETAASTTATTTEANPAIRTSTVVVRSTSSVSATTPAAASGTKSGTATPTPEAHSSKSKAWIAGAVIGPLALIAIAGLLFWIFRLKRRNKENKNHQPAPAVSQVNSPLQQYQQGYGSPPPQNADYSTYKGHYDPSPTTSPSMQQPQAYHDMPQGAWGAPNQQMHGGMPYMHGQKPQELQAPDSTPQAVASRTPPPQTTSPPPQGVMDSSQISELAGDEGGTKHAK